MSYGVVTSQDSFVFTKYGVVTIKELGKTSELMGISGVSNTTKLQEVGVSATKLPTGLNATRLITQATDSILLPSAKIFLSE